MSTLPISHNESVTLLELICSLTSVKNSQDLQVAAHEFNGLVECDNLIFGIPDSDLKEPVNDLNINYPQEWVDLYQKMEYWRIDPAVLCSRMHLGPIHWDYIYSQHPPKCTFLEQAYDFGIIDGWTCFTPGNFGLPWTIISVAGKFQRNKQRTKYILSTLTPHFHLAISAVQKQKHKVDLIEKLTGKEIEVLKWVAQGKTSWETSQILGVAEATVNYHLKMINKRLNTVNRSQAVALALGSGLLDD